ncbi:hypothetical protein A3Q56_05513 [Intoshia linei]|uniref:Nucleoplasmin core domain-containing protein n=1 Tax=Intoshia linei TaxID=1819745 RepID=A0A177AXP5_9BILA|nr:hypothetical protein A3Q56_05513 [Intoshia linei]
MNTNVLLHFLISRKIESTSKSISLSNGSDNIKIKESYNSMQFWGCELNSDKTRETWTDVNEKSNEYLKINQRALSIKSCVLGPGAIPDQRNVIGIETYNFDKGLIKQPILSLTLGKNDMISLDLGFAPSHPVDFILMAGDGPVFLGGEEYIDLDFTNEDLQDEHKIKKRIEEKKRRKEENEENGESVDMEEEDDEMEEGSDEDGQPKKKLKKKDVNAKKIVHKKSTIRVSSRKQKK